MSVRFSLLLALLLPFAASAAAPAATPVEGTDYELIRDGAPYDATPGKIEVVEVFGYTCPHCAHFQPVVEAWASRLPADVRFTPVAAPFGGSWMDFARAYYAAKALGIAERSHDAVFRGVHEDGLLPRNATADELASFYSQFGVQPARFVAMFNSPGVEAEVAKADAFIRRSGVDGTPTLVVAGKYRVIGHGNQQALLQVVDALVARERAAAKSTRGK